jgi:hypothetical protein
MSREDAGPSDADGMLTRKDLDADGPTTGPIILIPSERKFLSWSNPKGGTCHAASYDGCRHTGTLFQATLGDQTDCGALRIYDALGAFRWRCAASAKGVQITSFGFSSADMGLAHLIDQSGQWKPNQLIVEQADGTVRKSRLDVWFKDPIVVPHKKASLDFVGDGTIYFFKESVDVPGISVTGASIAIVVAPGQVVRYDGAGRICQNESCLLEIDTAQHVWIEGRFVGKAPANGEQAHHGIVVDHLKYARFHRVSVEQTTRTGLELRSIQSCELSRIAQQRSYIGIVVEGGRFNRALDVRVAANNGEGLVMKKRGSSELLQHFILSYVIAQGNGLSGIELGWGVSHVIGSRIVSFANGHSGIKSEADGPLTLTHITVAGNSYRGIETGGTAREVIAQVLSFNNGSTGIYVSGSQASELSQLVIGFNNYGLTTTDKYRLTGSLVFANNTKNCTGSGVVHRQCTETGRDNTSDWPQGSPSTATLFLPDTLQGSVKGKVTSDQACRCDTDGVCATVDDYWQTAWPLRLFGHLESSSGLPATGDCQASCQIWDLRTERTGQIWGKADDFKTSLATFTDGQACPKSTSGASQLHLTDAVQAEVIGQGGNDDGICDPTEPCHEPNTFIVNAVEILGDGEGDDDGLCEANERCLYSPHFGAGQLERGESLRECVFDNSSKVRGVTLLGPAH